MDNAVAALAAGLSDFHFLRPAFLLLLLLPLGLFFLNRSKLDKQPGWARYIEPELLQHLLLQPKRSRWLSLPFYSFLLSFLWLLVMAGPSWQLSAKNLNQGQQSIMLVLKLDASMLLEGPRGSGLALAKVKVLDFIQHQQSAAIGLLVYAGSAHSVLPPSKDHSVLKKYLSDLSPLIMPKPGNNPQQALRLAEQVLASSNGAGTKPGDGYYGAILFFSDSESAALSNDQNIGVNVSRSVIIVDPDVVKGSTYFRQQGFNVIPLSIDDTDVIAAARSFSQAWRKSKSAEDDWLDQGYYGVWVLLLLLLPWFRKGMVMP